MKDGDVHRAGNPMRDKALAILWTALLPQELVCLAETAAQLEAAIHAQHARANGGDHGSAVGDPGPAYKNRLRVLYGWLSSSDGAALPELKRSLLQGLAFL